jgi:hypothetical protein
MDPLDTTPGAPVAAGRAQAKSLREARDQPFARRTKIVKKLDVTPKQHSSRSPQDVYRLEEKEIDEIVEAELYHLVIVREGEKNLELTLILAILMGLGNDALQCVQVKKASVKQDFSSLSEQELDTLERLLSKTRGSDQQ